MLQFMATEGLLDNGLKLRVASLPDKYIDHADRGRQLADSGLDADSLVALAGEMTSVRPAKATQDNA